MSIPKRPAAASRVAPVSSAPRRGGRASVSRRAQALRSLGLTCPVCYGALCKVEGERAEGSIASIAPPEELSCSSCGRSYASSSNFFDLSILPTEALGGNLVDALTTENPGYRERNWSVSQLFQSPVISYVYERGWRQGFDWAGFPGADEEFDIVKKMYSDTRTGEAEGGPDDAVLDVSCGTGLFSRKFLKSGMFKTVVASDYSANMLDQAYSFLNESESGGRSDDDPDLLFVRADVSRLPFERNTFDLVHAGAAIHCWPTPSTGISDICRVLKPGGRLIGSTFLLSASPLGERLGSDDIVRPLFEIEKEFSGGLMPGLTGRTYRFWSEKELKDLCELCGLENFSVVRKNRFIMYCATKKKAPPPSV